MAKILTPHFVAAFPNVYTATSYMESEPKFSVTAIFHPDKFNAKEKRLWANLLSEVDRICMETFKKKASMLPKNFKLGLRDGAEKPDLNGFTEDCIFANLSSKFKPDIVDVNGQPVDKSEGRVYAGCIMRATVTPYAYNNVGKGYSIGLNNIQLLRWDTSRIDGRTSASEDFSSEDDEFENLAAAYESTTPADVDDEIPF